MAEYFIRLRKKIKKIPIIIDLWACGLMGAWYEVVYAKDLVGKFIRLTRLVRFAIADYRHYRAFEYFMVVSSEARQYILKRYPEKKVLVTPNGIDTPEPKEVEIQENSIIYTGDMSFFPNIDAVKYFVKDIFPKVKQKIKDAKFYIVGINPVQEVRDLAENDSSIVVTGYVDDVREYLYKSKVYVCPLRSGSGIRTKVLEVFSCKKPVVITPMALEGITAQHNKEVMIADDPKDFAQHVIALLEDDNLRVNLGEKAYDLVVNEYNWHKISEDVKDYYIKMKENCL